MNNFLRTATSSAAALLGMGVFSLALSGCGMSSTSVGSGASTTGSGNNTFHVSGTVMGGQQPVSGAYIQLYAAGTSFGSGAIPLIPTSTTGTPDGTAQSIVSTNSGGYFNISNDYTCPSPTSQVYITSVGGNPGISGMPTLNSTSLALVAALGSCGNLNSSTNIVINEATTVAAIWALQNFINIPFSATGGSLWTGGGTCSASGTGTAASPYSCVSGTATTTPATGFSIGSSSTNIQGMMNAFNTANILVNTTYGQSPGANSSGTANTIEYWNVYGIANILAACINSTGPTSSQCTTLFNNTTYIGGSSSGAKESVTAINYTNGTVPGGSTALTYQTYSENYAPADVLQAAWVMARNPTTNVSNLFMLASTSPPFTGPTSMPDFTIGYQITGNFDGNPANTSGNGQINNFPSAPAALPLASPLSVAFDKYGNAFVSNPDIKGSYTGGAGPYNPFITELDPNGNYVKGGFIPGYYVGSTLTPFAGSTSNTLTWNAGNSNLPFPIVFDESNNFYAYDEYTGYVAKFVGPTSAGGAASISSSYPAINTGLVASTNTAKNLSNLVYDGNGNLWLTALTSETTTVGSQGGAPFNASTSGDYMYAFPTTLFGTSPTGTGNISTNAASSNYAIGSAAFGLVVDNSKPSATTGAPYVYVGDISFCNGSSMLASTAYYGDIQAFYGTATGTQSRNSLTAFSPLVDWTGSSTTGLSNQYFTSSTGCPQPANPTTSGLQAITSLYTGDGTASVLPIAQPYSMAVDSSNNLWVLNELTPAVSTTTYTSYPPFSLVKITPPASITGSGSSTSFTPVASNSGGGLNAPGLGAGKTQNYANLGIAVDGAGSVWVSTQYGVSEFDNNDNAISGSTTCAYATNNSGFCGGYIYNGSSYTKARPTNTWKTVSVDRSGNVWLPGGSTPGAVIEVIVGAATAVTTPLLPPNQGALP